MKITLADLNELATKLKNSWLPKTENRRFITWDEYFKIKRDK